MLFATTVTDKTCKSWENGTFRLFVLFMGHKIDKLVARQGTTKLWQSNVYRSKTYNNYFCNDLFNLKKFNYVANKLGYEILSVYHLRIYSSRREVLIAVALPLHMQVSVRRLRRRVNTTLKALQRTKNGQRAVAHFNILVARRLVEYSRTVLSSYFATNWLVAGQVFFFDPITTSKRHFFYNFYGSRLFKQSVNKPGLNFLANPNLVQLMNFFYAYPYIDISPVLVGYIRDNFVGEFRSQLRTIQSLRRLMLNSHRRLAKSTFEIISWVMVFKGKLIGARRTRTKILRSNRASIKITNLRTNLYSAHATAATRYGTVQITSYIWWRKHEHVANSEINTDASHTDM